MWRKVVKGKHVDEILADSCLQAPRARKADAPSPLGALNKATVREAQLMGEEWWRGKQSAQRSHGREF